ncbi:murein hydrolase activator EnvC family protein [Sphingomonas sp. URHD0057]|uniref:murein hydrolase activator EnvC family protein n=1 Tax=Sphingomonas sp. URHD0057 TaxID=1380389 RepID=UPI000685A5F0|nr:peptidoglycan DD-metalloendopeptidase family protein [Sphingomonas sp. URHD0057]
MSRLILVLIGAPLLAAASVPAAPVAAPINDELAQAKAEQRTAEAETARLEKAAAEARDEATRLRAQQDAAAQAIDAAEARISSSDAALRLASAYVANHRRELDRQQRPVALLLAGLATMAERPPLLALADRGGTDELVKVRILLDSTMPVIRRRTAALSARLAEGQRLERSVIAARADVVKSRQDLSAKRQQFASLEQRSIERALASGSRALGTGDTAIAAGENVERLRGAEVSSRDAVRLAAEVAALDPAPPRPAEAEPGPGAGAPFAYRLPAEARVTEGLGSVNDSGVQSRGLTLATARGTQLSAPASGTVRFSGPFRDYDGILVLDHGNGWMTLIVNLSSPLAAGARVSLGDPVGRALGPIQVELSQNGRRVSPALIAGSSATLSKDSKGR